MLPPQFNDKKVAAAALNGVEVVSWYGFSYRRLSLSCPLRLFVCCGKTTDITFLIYRRVEQAVARVESVELLTTRSFAFHWASFFCSKCSSGLWWYLTPYRVCVCVYPWALGTRVCAWKANSEGTLPPDPLGWSYYAGNVYLPAFSDSMLTDFMWMGVCSSCNKCRWYWVSVHSMWRVWWMEHRSRWTSSCSATGSWWCLTSPCPHCTLHLGAIYWSNCSIAFLYFLNIFHFN